MKIHGARRQRGAALIALLVIVVLGTSWMLVSALGKTANRTAAEREHNARVLAEAKTALVAWVAINALDSTEDNPGRLPCPQYWGDVGSSNEGRAGASCISAATPTQPAAGWLPWRTLGLSKLLDSSGAQLWYVVSPGWASRTDAANLTINSNSLGQLTVDGQANASVAMIIAPGQALGISPNPNQAAAGCVARNQSQALNLPTTAPNPLDFLECQNGSTTDGSFVSSVVDNATNQVFNDQVVTVTTADILPALEAVIAKRIERDIVPVLRGTAYSGTKWNPAASNTVYQFAAPFSNPGASIFQGLAGAYQGLLPFSYLPPCSPAGDPRCTISTFHAWGTPTLSRVSGSGSLSGSPSCSVSGTLITCAGYYVNNSLQSRFADPVSNVANALRDFNLAEHTATVWTILYDDGYGWDGWQTASSTLRRRFNGNGSLSFEVDAPFRWSAGTDYGYYYIEAQRPVITNHSAITSINTVFPWFMRNEWYRLLYYAIAPNHAAGGTLACEETTPTCLQVANVTPANKQRSILILAGRSLAGASRPNQPLSDYLEGANADLNTAFEQRAINRSFNDRIMVIDANP